MPKGPEWNASDDAIVLYFASRKVSNCYKIVKDLIKEKGGPERTISSCESRVKIIREEMRDEGLEDPWRRNDKYNLDVVDPWLERLMGKEDLKKWLGVQGDKIVDPTVLGILEKHV